MPPDELDLTCPECDYNLTGAPGDRCPWCGWEIEVEALVAAHRGLHRMRRISVACAAATIAGASVVAMTSLLRMPQGRLSLLDGIAVLSVFVAVMGHLGLVVVAGFGQGPWPLRGGTAAELLRFAGWVSVVGGIVGGASFLQVAPTPLVVRGVPVNGGFEFVLGGVLYSLPGFMLLGLRLVSVRVPGRTKRKAASNETNGATFVVEAVGPIAPDRLSQTWTDRPRPTTAAIEERIARTWETQTALAQVDGRRLYNGDLVRLVAARVTDSALHLELGPTCYRDFVGTNLYAASLTREHGAEFLGDALGISATVITSDGLLAYGRRNQTVAFHGGYLHTFGGLIERSDVRADGVCDVVGAMMRELEEELGLIGNEVRNLAITGLVRDRAILQPELLFDVTIGLSRSDLVARFERIVEGQEHERIEFVADEPEAIVPFLSRSAPVAPVAAAAMLLHGKINWGDAWYEQACYVLFGEAPKHSGVGR